MSNVNTPAVMAQSMAESLFRENSRLKKIEESYYRLLELDSGDVMVDTLNSIDRLRAENATLSESVTSQALLIASLKDEAKWKVQAEALWSMALILETEIKDESKNALFRSGVQVSIAKLKTTAQMLMDFHEDYKWNAENATEQLPK